METWILCYLFMMGVRLMPESQNLRFNILGDSW